MPPIVVAACTEDAPAKVNLALHVTGRRADGYHELDSIVVFAREGDRLDVSPADRDGFEVQGPFAEAIPVGSDNLVVRALALARRVAGQASLEIAPLHLRLSKQLPPASGIGGGSADAAALLRSIARACPDLRLRLREAATGLGADVPMCFDGRSARVRGIGEISSELPALPALFILLVNPRIEVSTPLVFSRLISPSNSPIPMKSWPDPSAFIDWLATCRNDLQDPAIAIEPTISEALAMVEAAGARLARMSGSGATVFGLFETLAEAQNAAEKVLSARPGWWVRASEIVPTEAVR